MSLPNAHLAIVDLRKLQTYCLNPFHEEGKHKAHLFLKILEMTVEDAPVLQEKILEAVRTCSAEMGLRDSYGQRYIVDFVVEWHGRKALVRSGWIVEHQQEIPRLITCYPLKEVLL